jgi:hypothetical protein
MKSLDAHLAVKEENSSCMRLEAESSERMVFSAPFLIFLISSFSAH